MVTTRTVSQNRGHTSRADRTRLRATPARSITITGPVREISVNATNPGTTSSRVSPTLIAMTTTSATSSETHGSVRSTSDTGAARLPC